jgi:hypothetical protein
VHFISHSSGGVRLVRELYGTEMADKATAGVLVINVVANWYVSVNRDD